MAVASFTKGTSVELDGRMYKILRQVDQDLWQLENQRTGRVIEHTIQELEAQYVGGKLVFANQVIYPIDQMEAKAMRDRDDVAQIQMSAEELENIKVKNAYVKAVETLPTSESLMKPAILQVWKKLGEKGKPPHWTTVSRWKKRYLDSGRDGLALMHKNHRKGNREPRFPEQVIKIVQDSIEEQYLTLERKTVADTLTHAIVYVERENKMLNSATQLPLPTRRLVQSMINKIDAFDRHVARYGRMAAVKRFRTVLHANVTDKPLECAEIDHTMLDLMVVDAKTGMPFGRPWLTVCIDRMTRCVLGIYIGFEPPSYLTVARCLKHAFMPKANLKQDYPDIEHEWMAYGVMIRLIVDNGREFHSISLETLCMALGIDLQYTPRKTPWLKGIVERFIGTLNREVAHGVPGTTFSNIFEKEDYDPLKHAVITLDDLKQMLFMWVVDVYHQRPHRSLNGYSPAKVWLSSITREEINLPDNPDRLDVILGTTQTRVLSTTGIQYEGLFYNSNELTALRNLKGSNLNVELRIDEGNLGHIYVIDPDDKQIFKVKCIDSDYAEGLTKWQHGICKKYSKNQGLDNGINGWRHAKVKISEFINNAWLVGKKRKTNAKVGRYKTATSTSEKELNNDQHLFALDSSALDTALISLPLTSAKGETSKKFKPIIDKRDTD